MWPGLEEPFPLHLAQAMCYGYFYCCDHELEQIGIQLTYCSLETEEIKRFRSQHTRAELCQWFQGVIGEYFKWARYQYRHRESRDQSIRGAGISLSLPGGPEGSGRIGLPRYFQEKAAVYPSPYGDRKDAFRYFPGGEGGWGRKKAIRSSI